MKISEFVSTCHALQDTFALEVCGKNGRWLEIGAHFPIQGGNNTALLELHGWNGISLEIDEKYREEWKKSWRNDNALIIADAAVFDYASFTNKHFDYIQIDTEPPEITYQCLEKILADGITFDCLTFEHDLYVNKIKNKIIKDQAYALLTKHNYKRVIDGVKRLDMPRVDFEDWYVANHIDFPIIDYYEWAKTAYNKYCKHLYKLKVRR